MTLRLISGSIFSEMKVFAVLLSVASVAVANIPYTEPGVRPGPGGVADVRPIVPVVQQPILPGGIATGAAGGDLSQGQFTGVHGTSQVQQLSSSAQVSNVEQNENFKRITHPRDTFVITKVSWCFLLPKWSLRVRCHNLKSLSGVRRSGKQLRIVMFWQLLSRTFIVMFNVSFLIFPRAPPRMAAAASTKDHPMALSPPAFLEVTRLAAPAAPQSSTEVALAMSSISARSCQSFNSRSCRVASPPELLGVICPRDSLRVSTELLRFSSFRLAQRYVMFNNTKVAKQVIEHISKILTDKVGKRVM